MSELIERIAGVLREHRYLPEGACSCGHDSVEAAPENWAYHQDRHHDRHVAERVAEALQLTEDLRRINPQTKAKPCDNCGHLKGVHASPCHILNRDYRECGCPEHTYTPPNTSWERRWVSGWSAVEGIGEAP